MSINRRLTQLNANRYGQYQADPSAAWEAGMVATLGANGVTVAGTASTPVGILLNNNLNALTRAVVGESLGPVDYRAANGATLSVTLSHNNLVSGGYLVFAGATVLAETTDYTINTTTGVITAVASGKLDSLGGSYTNAGMISVNYRYNMTAAELQGFLDNKGQVIGGPGMLNTFDEVNILGQTSWAGEGNVIYTDQFDTSVNWTAALGSYVYANADGRLTTTQGGGKVGFVTEIPSATQPFLGITVSL
jgi:hypothetical protein